MNIQIFGTKKCKDTKKAARFFKAELEADIIVAEDIPGKAKIYDFLDEHGTFI